MRPSMGSVGDAYDNAMCESFFATLECELLDRHRFRTHADARLAIFDFIEGWYNPRRRHSALGYLRPGYFRAPPRERRSPCDSRIDDRPGGCYLGIPLEAGVVAGMASRKLFTLHQTGATPVVDPAEGCLVAPKRWGASSDASAHNFGVHSDNVFTPTRSAIG